MPLKLKENLKGVGRNNEQKNIDSLGDWVKPYIRSDGSQVSGHYSLNPSC